MRARVVAQLFYKRKHCLSFQVISRHVELLGKHPQFEQREQVTDFTLAVRQTNSENCSSVLAKRARCFQILVSNNNFIYLTQQF